ncbi:MAG: PfkB family carbohydrate kinase, partial [bacterium]
MKRFDCIGFGLATLDHLSLVESFPQPGRKLEVAESAVEGGGPVATALATLARLGASVAYCGRLGDDLAGRQVIDSFKRCGVNVKSVIMDSSAVTPIATVLVEQGSGRRTVLLNPGRGCFLRAGEVRENLIQQTLAVHLDGRRLAVERRVARYARRYGVTTFLDVGSLRNSVENLLHDIDHFVVAEEYALGITGRRSQRLAARDLWLPSMKSLTITAGRQGAIAFDGRTFYRQPAFEVEIKDVTGAGDAFHGG